MNETLAANSNIALYFAMAVFTIAMVSYAVDLAGFAPRPPRPPSPRQARELVAAGGPGDGRHGRRPAGRRHAGRSPAGDR